MAHISELPYSDDLKWEPGKPSPVPLTREQINGLWSYYDVMWISRESVHLYAEQKDRLARDLSAALNEVVYLRHQLRERFEREQEILDGSPV